MPRVLTWLDLAVCAVLALPVVAGVSGRRSEKWAPVFGKTPLHNKELKHRADS
jgi:hypothetical protein